MARPTSHASEYQIAGTQPPTGTVSAGTKAKGLIQALLKLENIGFVPTWLLVVWMVLLFAEFSATYHGQVFWLFYGTILFYCALVFCFGYCCCCWCWLNCCKAETFFTVVAVLGVLFLLYEFVVAPFWDNSIMQGPGYVHGICDSWQDVGRGKNCFPLVFVCFTVGPYVLIVLYCLAQGTAKIIHTLKSGSCCRVDASDELDDEVELRHSRAAPLLR
jgi:hypothetical protein